MLESFAERFKKRPLSHSQLSSWEYNPEEWYRRYILGEWTPPTPNMIFGNTVGDSIGTPKSLVPDLVPPGIKEYRLTAEVDGIPLIGYADHYCPDTRVLHENKTSETRGRWTQGKADKHTQIDMYLLMLYLSEGVPPETVECYLNFIQTRPTGLGYRLHKDVRWRQFRVATKTMADLDRYQEYLLATVEAMHEYAEQRAVINTSAPRPPAFKGV